TTAFRWIAVAFTQDRSLAQTMAGRFFLAGEADTDRVGAWVSRLLDSGPSLKERVANLHEEGLTAQPEAEALIQPVTRDDRLLALIIAGDKRGDDAQISSVDMKLVAAAGSYLAIHLENASLYIEQQAMFLGTLKALTASIDAKDRYTRGHSERVAHLTRQLAA